MKQQSLLRCIFSQKDTRWLIAWLSIMGIVVLWDARFLNKPAFALVAGGFVNTFLIAGLVIVFTLCLGWITTIILHSLREHGNHAGYLSVTFMLNLLRSIPQIIGVLCGYVCISWLHDQEIVRSHFVVFVLLALCMSVFIFLELVDLMRDRIAHYQKLDFYSAMRVCGMKESRIVNYNILWNNSRVHIFNKLISIFGMAVFLQCSVDFIISVGLSTDVNEVTLPVTLGSLLAKIDSKQDILAIGYTLTHPLYAGNLLFQHLQGITVAFLIVFTLMSIYNIANGFTQRHRL